MSEDLRVISITITNVRKIAKATIRFGRPAPGTGQLIVFKGDNGEGKTSLLRGISALFDGGYDPAIIRDGAEAAVIEASLSNDVELSRTINRKRREPLKVTVPPGMPPITQVETYVKKLASGLGFDPLDFCMHNGEHADAKKKNERLEYLMNVFPVTISSAEFMNAVGEAFSYIPLKDRPKGNCNIAAANKVLRGLEIARGPFSTNSEIAYKAAEHFRVTLSRNEQAEEAFDWRADLAAQKKEQNRLLAADRSALQEIELAITLKRSEMVPQIRVADDAVKTEFDTLLKAARGGESKGLESGLLKLAEVFAFLAKLSSELEGAEVDAESKKNAAKVANAQALQEVAVSIVTAEAGIERQVQTETIRNQMRLDREEGDKHKATHLLIDNAVKNLEKLKKSKLVDLPVSGLEISAEDDVKVDGRLFDDLNGGFMYTKAMEIGAQGCGDLNLLIADESTRLGPPAMAEFEQAVIDSGLTVVMTRLCDAAELEEFGPGLRSEPAQALLLEGTAK